MLSTRAVLSFSHNRWLERKPLRKSFKTLHSPKKFAWVQTPPTVTMSLHFWRTKLNLHLSVEALECSRSQRECPSWVCGDSSSKAHLPYNSGYFPTLTWQQKYSSQTLNCNKKQKASEEILQSPQSLELINDSRYAYTSMRYIKN